MADFGNPLDRAEYMLRYASEAVELARTRQVEDLENDRTFELALAHLIQHVGTLAGSGSERPTTGYTALDREADRLHTLRNQIAHEFDPMNRVALWQAATETFPAIIPDLHNLIADLQQVRIGRREERSRSELVVSEPTTRLIEHRIPVNQASDVQRNITPDPRSKHWPQFAHERLDREHTDNYVRKDSKVDD